MAHCPIVFSLLGFRYSAHKIHIYISAEWFSERLRSIKDEVQGKKILYLNAQKYRQEGFSL